MALILNHLFNRTDFDIISSRFLNQIYFNSLIPYLKIEKDQSMKNLEIPIKILDS